MKNLKRLGIFVVALFVAFSFCACGKKSNNNNNSDNANNNCNSNGNLSTKYTVTFVVDTNIYKKEEIAKIRSVLAKRMQNQPRLKHDSMLSDKELEKEVDNGRDCDNWFVSSLYCYNDCKYCESAEINGY